MPAINLLSKEISELIAAGEVIERPSSVIKELIENSIDAGARHITVEIKRGGSTFIRVTDDGCGIAFDDVPKAFLRHATSKITSREDLNSILTLGFRGEALASVCAVSKVEIMTKQKDDELGTHYITEGSQEVMHEKTGCPDGTTIIIRDLFYNVPARQKFMKKDTVEGNMVSSIVDKIALSHPEISFRMIRDNKAELSTSGDGNLYSSIFAVYGKNFAADMIEVDYELDGIRVSGYCVKPLYSKANRVFQNFFVNERYIKSQVCASALEEAYKGVIMVGKFPACVLKIGLAPDTVDVNVHPAKVEVRFSDDKPIYNCIYFAVKSALMKAGMIYDFELEKTAFSKSSASESEKEEVYQPEIPVVPEKSEKPPLQNVVSDISKEVFKENKAEQSQQTVDEVSVCNNTKPEKPENLFENNNVRPQNLSAVPAYTAVIKENPPIKPIVHSRIEEPVKNEEKVENFSYINRASLQKTEPEPEKIVKPAEEKKELRYIGEAFKGYIISEIDDKIVIVDKHAAHERIIFERLKKQGYESSQLIMCAEGILLSLDEADALSENRELLEKMGFSLDLTNSPYVTVKALPSIIAHLNPDELIPELAENFRKNKLDPRPEAIDDILHTVACKAAIKMNDKNSSLELEKLVNDVYNDENIRHCPHGRPVMFVITKYELEKQFRRKV
ncbi:MAG: DNA mismatch repair endonuclease MutL [Oscillospiraceae bacterium]|nr:DNA mismatch repair endonuclease MutL [Oscillospiraceae bacterium]